MIRKYIYSEIVGEICSFYFFLQPNESVGVRSSGMKLTSRAE
ncbi:hypothetical protein LEMLEM_LOCUS1963 [Lemmus lemmus]